MHDDSRPLAAMPHYQSHKRVWALKVKGTTTRDNGGYVVEVEDGFEPITVPASIFARGVAQPGDYLVQYGDGYWSWSPAKPFEEGYVRCGYGLTFGDAVRELKAGSRVCRSGWNGKGMWLVHVVPERDLFFSAEKSAGAVAVVSQLPWIGMKTADGKFVPWLASQTDVLANDWMVVTVPAASPPAA